MTKTLSATVTAKRAVAIDIFAFTLTVDAADYIAADAGAHIDVCLPNGLVRQYSLTRAAPPGANAYEVAVLCQRDGRGGSLAMCDEVGEGASLLISGPRNHFALEPGHLHYALISGGIGITPILAMAWALHEQGASFEFELCARTPEHVAFKPEIGTAPWADRVNYHYDEVEPTSMLDLGSYLRGLEPTTQVYICGPAGMLEAATALTADWPSGRVRMERFVAREPVLDAGVSGSFTVELAKTGASYAIGPDQSILDVLVAHRIEVDHSCREGTCGTCVTRVEAGDLIHLDSCLYADEHEAGNCMAICVSRAKPGTILVLDL